MKDDLSMHKTERITENQYETSSFAADQTSRVSITYQLLLGPEINIYQPSNVVLGSMFCDGHFYQIWKGKLIDKKATPLDVMIKKTKGFASVEAVRSREKWEEENNLPRPIQWLSPETIKLNHIIQSDVWSFGVLMWEVFSGEGKMPFGYISSDDARQKVLNGQRPIKPLKCSGELFDIMTHCWMQQPYNRLTLRDIRIKVQDISQYEDV